MYAHVITCNDFPVYVVMEDKAQAEKLMKQMIDRQMDQLHITDRKEYDAIFDWVIRTVKGELPRVVRRRTMVIGRIPKT